MCCPTCVGSIADLRYSVVGQTHPRVLERDGEAYRTALIVRAAARGVADMVAFDASYLDVASLQRVVAQADVVVLPYESREQVTSGVLIEAVAAGKPVVATAFPHAVELLGQGAGLVVPHDDRQSTRSRLTSGVGRAGSGRIDGRPVRPGGSGTAVVLSGGPLP